MTAVDEALLQQMGDDAIGIISTCWYSAQIENPLNKKFVEGMNRDYKVDPGFYAAATYTNGAVLEAALNKISGKIEDKDALRAALRAADFKSVRGDFKFNKNQFPVQNYYLQLVGKGPDGRIVHKTMGTVLTARGDAYVQDCKMQ
jgi:branched-chain amino acid transport system substrate-binding protein